MRYLRHIAVSAIAAASLLTLLIVSSWMTFWRELASPFAKKGPLSDSAVAKLSEFPTTGHSQITFDLSTMNQLSWAVIVLLAIGLVACVIIRSKNAIGAIATIGMISLLLTVLCDQYLGYVLLSWLPWVALAAMVALGLAAVLEYLDGKNVAVVDKTPDAPPAHLDSSSSRSAHVIAAGDDPLR